MFVKSVFSLDIGLATEHFTKQPRLMFMEQTNPCIMTTLRKE